MHCDIFAVVRQFLVMYICTSAKESTWTLTALTCFETQASKKHSNPLLISMK